MSEEVAALGLVWVGVWESDGEVNTSTNTSSLKKPRMQDDLTRILSRHVTHVARFHFLLRLEPFERRPYSSSCWS